MNLRAELKKGMVRGFGFFLVVFMGTLTTLLVAQTLKVFSSGDLISASEINDNFSTLNTSVDTINTTLAKMAPVGTILAWHKSFTGTPALPDGWVECDGSVVNDADSVYDGQTLPDLNSNIISSGGRFLRGATTSGTLQNDQFQAHQHNYTAHDALGAWGVGGDAQLRTATGTSWSYVADGGNGTPRTGNETFPLNMSVVWIIRIK